MNSKQAIETNYGAAAAQRANTLQAEMQRRYDLHDELVEVVQRIVNSCQEFLDGEDCDPYDLVEAMRNDASEVWAKAKGTK